MSPGMWAVQFTFDAAKACSMANDMRRAMDDIPGLKPYVDLMRHQLEEHEIRLRALSEHLAHIEAELKHAATWEGYGTGGPPPPPSTLVSAKLVRRVSVQPATGRR